VLLTLEGKRIPYTKEFIDFNSKPQWWVAAERRIAATLGHCCALGRRAWKAAPHRRSLRCLGSAGLRSEPGAGHQALAASPRPSASHRGVPTHLAWRLAQPPPLRVLACRLLDLNEGKVPVIKHGDFIMHDSDKIVEWLEEKFPQPAFHSDVPADV
jgi:hypothetical protein